MILRKPVVWLCVSAIISAGALFVVRLVSPAFGPETITSHHPVVLLCLAITISGASWFALLIILQRPNATPKASLAVFLLLGVLFRLMFFGSQPIYENDYKRYLWDGAVTAANANPYQYSAQEIFDASQPGSASVPDLARLAVMSNEANFLTGEINSPTLTTIYPPASQAMFALAHVISPYDANGLRAVFLLLELFGLGVLLLALRQGNLPLMWSSLYWLNPVIILTTYNGIHMDVLLVLPILSAVLAVKSRPVLAAIALSVAAAVKIWPLLLAPVIFRRWRHRPMVYIGVAGLTAALTTLAMLPMLLTLNDQAGLTAYSANWTNSSFLFPGLRDALGVFTDASDQIARYLIAIGLTVFSLWLGFSKSRFEASIPIDLMALSAAFVFLSPTGYPWYFIWFLMFLPLAAKSWMARGLGLLSIGAAAYYARFALGEAGHYDIYARGLLPLEFGVPLLVLAWDRWKWRRKEIQYSG